MTLEKAIQKIKRQGFDTNYELRFDAFVSLEKGEGYRIADLDSMDGVSFNRKDDEELTFLFTFTTVDGSNGYVVIDLQTHTDPISIEVIEALELPNLSRP